MRLRCGAFPDGRFASTLGTREHSSGYSTALPTRRHPTHLAYEALIIDADTAVTVAIDTSRGTRDGAAHAADYKHTVTYIRPHGTWLALGGAHRPSATGNVAGVASQKHESPRATVLHPIHCGPVLILNL
jgi:hypothetical protein